MKGKKILIIAALFLACYFANQALADVYVVSIDKDIGKGLREYIKRAIQYAEKRDADLILFDIKTYGGAVDAAEDIVDNVSQTEIPTIAYVNPKAISAGAMISIACDQIVMTPDGRIGAAAPVIGITGQEAPPKMVSVIRATLKAIAESKGRNPHIAEAMVDKKRILVRLNDEIISLNTEEYDKKLIDDEEMEVLVQEDDLLTLTAEEAMEYSFADGIAKSKDEILEEYMIFSVNGELMPLTIDKVKDKRAAGQVVEKLTDLKGMRLRIIPMTLAEQLASWITSAIISSLLLTFGMLGVIMELRTPGFGVPGIIGVICLAIFFGGHMVANPNINATYAALAFIIGFGLLMVEILVIPGFGFAGISGIILMIGGILFIFGKSYEPGTAVLWLSSSFILTCALGVVLFYTLPKTSAWQKFILTTEQKTELGYQAPPAEWNDYMGQTGVAITALRPSGTAMIGNSRVDVVTEGDFIDKGTPIKVVEVEGIRVVVREANEEDWG